MFHSKEDVDRHVNEVFRNIKSEYQRNLKCYQIAKLYFKFKDYKSAIKYINRYIFTTTNSAAAYRLLGECYLEINLKLKALDAYKASLELNGSQHDLVLKVCSLLMDPEVSSVYPNATYWLERAESLFPSNPVIFQLREHLLKSNLDGKQDNGQLEKLILSEINARPTDVTVRIRLLNFFVETKRCKVAYNHALEIESRHSFSNDFRWYDCLCNVVQAYEKAHPGELNLGFFIKKISFLERRVDLFMQEFHDEVKNLHECSSALFAFDQGLHAVSKITIAQDDSYFFTEFLKHMRAQLSFHLATLALKRAKKEYGVWAKAFRISSPLLLQATENTMDFGGAWYSSMWNGKSKMERDLKQWNKSATFRISQAGHVLLAWAQSKGSKFLETVSQFCGGKWQSNVYQNIFCSKEHQLATATSHFVNDPSFANVPMRLLSESELSHFDKVSQSAYPDSLHHLVWLGLAYCNANGQLSPDFRCMTVPNLQFTVENLSQYAAETLNQLDVDAFLYASVLCAKSATISIVSSDRPSRLPVSISEELCSSAQAEWWAAVYKTYRNFTTPNAADLRLKLGRGIETIRAYGQHGMHVKLIVMLAKLFQERAAKNKNPNELRGLEERAHLYWSAAIPLLEKIEKNLQIREVPNRLFEYRGKDLTPKETKGYLEDGRLFLACRLMKQGQHEQAIEAFQQLKSPYASFYQAMIYTKLASEEVNHRPESITSENRSQHIILLTRARDALYLTLDRLRCPSVDPNHPLNSQLKDHLEDIEKQLARIDPVNSFNRNGDSESDETDTAPAPLSPDVDENLDSSFNVYNTRNFMNLKTNHPTRPARQNFSDKHQSERFEARPSSERLDAQLRHLLQTNTNGLQAIVEQLKEMKSTMQIELKDLGCVTRDLLAEMKRWNDRLEASSKRTTDSIKPEDLFELREEDFDDLNHLTQQYMPYHPNYPINRQVASTQGPSGITPVPSPVPPVSQVIPTADNPMIPPAFYPGVHGVPPIDGSMLLYQTLGYYAQNFPYGDNQNVPDYKGTGIQKGAPFAKNTFRTSEPAPAPVPVPVPSTSVHPVKPQPPNVVITSSDTLPAFTSAGPPVMSVTIPPQHIRGLTPSSATHKPMPNQIHPFQIQMPTQAQLVKDSPTEKLNTLTPTNVVSSSPIQPPIVSGVKPTPIQQTTPLTGTSHQNIEQTNVVQEVKPEVESNKRDETVTKLFDSQGKLSTLINEDWRDLGFVSVKIINDKKLQKTRLTMFQNQNPNPCVDHYITPDMKLEPLEDDDNGWVWTVHKSQAAGVMGMVFTAIPEKQFSIQFISHDEARDFEYAFKLGGKLTKGSPEKISQKTTPPKPSSQIADKVCKSCGILLKDNEKCSACESKTKANEKTNLGGFTFNSSPIVKPPVLNLSEPKEKPKEAPKPSPFAQFSFSTSTTASTTLTTTTTTTTSQTDSQPVESKGLFGNFMSKETTNIFSLVKNDPNSFKKDPNFKGFEGANTPVFGNLNKQNQSKTEETTPSKEKSKENEDDEDGDSEFVPTAEFTPVVDLPDLVDVKTGEENDKVLFDERAKLLRFDTKLKEWKERGVGNMKVLLNEESGKVRLIMRRELVLKVCCNHYLDENMQFKQLTTSQKALTWYAQDYSEGDLKAECLALSFKNRESMLNFLKIIEDTQSKMKNGRMEGTKVKEPQGEEPKNLKPLSELFKPKAGSWECGTCLIRNTEDKVKCVSCETPKPGTEAAASKGTASQPKLLGKGITFPPTTSTFTFGIPPSSTSSDTTTVTSTSTSAPKFSFGIPQNTSSAASVASSTTFSFGMPRTTAAVSDSTTNASSPAAKFSFGSSQVSSATTTPSATEFTFGSPKLSTTSASNVTPTFSFGMPKLGATTTPGVGSFSSGVTSSTTQVTSAPTSTPLTSSKFSFTTSNISADENAPVVNVFSGLAPKNEPIPFTFNLPKPGEQAKTESNQSQSSFSFKPEGKGNFEFSLSNIKPVAKPASITTPSPKGKGSGDGATSDEDDEPEEDNGDHIIVQPIVPLPDKVAINTGEEDENVLYSQRAKLYRFSNKEWKERGIGDIKILRHKTNSKLRLLMRREVVLKVCLNHYLTPEIDFMPKNEKTWQWSAADFSEGEVRYDNFAIRFKTPEIANEFKKAIDDARNNTASSPLNTQPQAKEPSAAMKNFTFAIPNVSLSKTSASTEIAKGLQSGGLDDDVLVVYENKVTPEQREKAMSLHLPPNFYAYLQAPDCPGCRGCDTDDAPVSVPQSAPVQSTPPTNTQSVFSTSSWGSLNFGKGDSSKVLFSFAGNQGVTGGTFVQTNIKAKEETKNENENVENEYYEEEEEEEEDEDDEVEEEEEEVDDEDEDRDEEEGEEGEGGNDENEENSDGEKAEDGEEVDEEEYEDYGEYEEEEK